MNVNLVHCCSLIFAVFILGVREMTIQVGDKVPAVGFSVMTGEGPKPISSEEIFSGKKVVFFAVPGAFTPGCSMTHLPGFVVDADALKG